MPSLKRAINYILHNRTQFMDSCVKNLGFMIPDRQYLQLRFRLNMGYWPDFNNPTTFNEKINWLKLYNRKLEYTTMVDKYAVKDYVAIKIGEEYIIPTLGVWASPEEIEWEKLPDQFVLKTTHGGGSCGVVVCADKSKLNKEEAVAKLRDSMNSDIYSILREWPYKNVKKQVIAEKFMAPRISSASSDLEDYKFFCFNGEPKYCQVIRDRHTKETIDFYDMEWNHQEFVGLNPIARNGLTPVERPKHLDDMIRVCKELSKDIPFVRVDLYVIDDSEYFGELTFYPASGFGRFTPDEWSAKIGGILTLPTEIRGGYKCLMSNNLITIQQQPAQYDELKDYKFFCFNGKVRCFKIDFNRFKGHRANYYSPEVNLLPFGEEVFPPDYAHREIMPSNLKEMVSIAEALSNGIPFLRVDLYNINGKIFFGETTFFPAGGLGRFTDEVWDKTLGNWIELN